MATEPEDHPDVQVFDEIRYIEHLVRTTAGSRAQAVLGESLMVNSFARASTCGTRLFAWRKNPAVAGVALAAFDDRNAFTPTEHIWVAEKIDWVKLDDGLPQYPGTIPL